ncbi:MAG: class I SAM-dependent methyltransferase [Myxococcota bacterium]
MGKPDSSGEFPDLLADQVGRWEKLADWWHQETGDADELHRELVIPSTKRLLELRPGEKVLDIGCGNGAFAREMAGLGAHVTAFDASETLIRIARKRSAGEADRIAWHVIDAASEEPLLALGEGNLDAAVAKMVLMDMAMIVPLLNAVGKLLKPGGRFVFSILHPAFNSTGSSLLTEEGVDAAGNPIVERSIKVFRYAEPEAGLGFAKFDQPQAQYYFHRPLSNLLGSCFRAGLVMDALEEPVFTPEQQRKLKVLWREMPAIPPVLIARLRRPLPPAP